MRAVKHIPQRSVAESRSADKSRRGRLSGRAVGSSEYGQSLEALWKASELR